MTSFGIQPRLKTKLGSRMIFLGLLCFGFRLHLSKWVKAYGTRTCWGWRPVHKDVALRAWEQWEGKLTGY